MFFIDTAPDEKNIMITQQLHHLLQTAMSQPQTRAIHDRIFFSICMLSLQWLLQKYPVVLWPNSKATFAIWQRVDKYMYNIISICRTQKHVELFSSKSHNVILLRVNDLPALQKAVAFWKFWNFLSAKVQRGWISLHHQKLHHQLPYFFYSMNLTLTIWTSTKNGNWKQILE